MSGLQRTGRETGANEDPRVRFAAERTLLAWIRTGLALMGFGFVVARFGLFLREIAVVHPGGPPHTSGSSLWIGTGLVFLGIAVVLSAAWQHWHLLQRLDRGEAFVAPRWSLGLIVAGLLAILGAAMVSYLFLVGT